MDNIEQIIKAAKLSARNEEQKSCAEVASIVYAAMKIKGLQNHVSQLQDIMRMGYVTENQIPSFNKAITDDLSEIQRLQTSLNLECTEQILDALKQKLRGR